MERKNTILTACTSKSSRQHLRYVLEETYYLLEAANAAQMKTLLRQNMGSIVLVVLGTSLGKEALAEPELKDIPVVVLNEEKDPALVPSLFRKGAADVIDLDYDSEGTFRRIDSVARLQVHLRHTDDLVREQARILQKSKDSMVEMLSSIIEYRSAETENHILRIGRFVRILLEEVMQRCPEYRLTEELVDIISSASALHDVGKIVIPDAILNKPGELTPEEWEIMKTHAAAGSELLEKLGGVADQQYLRYARNICRYHHERWDGGGYPDGLMGEQIPICAQVVGLADAYEALTAHRVYKPEYSFDQAFNMILKGECGYFSPKLLTCLKNVTEQFERLTRSGIDGTAAEEGRDMTLPIPEQDVSSLDRVQAMYQALIHYVNGFLMEVNLDQKLFHVIYNPYPEMSQIDGIRTFKDMKTVILDKIVVSEERHKIEAVLYEQVPRFIEKNLRRFSHRFHYRSLSGGETGQFELTFLRNTVPGSKRRSFAVLLRKVPEAESEGSYAAAWYSLAESTYVCRNDQDFTLVRMDRESSGLGGYTRKDIEEKFGGRLSQIVPAQDREWVRKEFTRQLRQGTEVRLEHRVVLQSGQIVWVTNKSRLVVAPNGEEHLHCYLTDITKTRTELDRLQQQQARYIDVLTKTENVLFEWDMETDELEVSDNWEAVFHLPAPWGKGMEWLNQGSHIHPDDVPLMMDRIIAMKNGSDQEVQELRMVTPRGRYLWYRLRAYAQRNGRGGLEKLAGTITCIESEKKKEQMLQDRAERDSLTKLLNKDAGRKRITDYLSQYPQGTSCAMLIIDLDDFKLVNDSFGHLFGDAVLARVAQQIKSQFTGQDIVVRIGGDEFMVLVRGLADRHLLEERCRRLIASFCQDLKSKHRSLNVGCSIGIALAPQDGKSYHELYNCADAALYQAKAQGKNICCFYEEGMTEKVRNVTTITRIDSDEMPGLAEDNIVRRIFQQLYSADDVYTAINEALAYVGRQMNVSRVYIFENSPDNLYCSNTFEWCNEGVEPQIDLLQNISYAEDIPGYGEHLTEQGLIYCTDIKELSDDLYQILEPQGIRSMLHCAIRPEGVLRGYIGFDDCVHHRLWTQEEIRLLTYFTEVLSTFLLKMRRQERITAQARDIMNFLEAQNNWVYIMDPGSWEIQYLNQQAKRSIPRAQVGMPCYEALYGRTEPCLGCTVRSIREEGKPARMVRRKGDSIELVEASPIRWAGKDVCLVSGRSLEKEELWETT